VLLGVVVTYLLVFVVAKVPRGMWRFSGLRRHQAADPWPASVAGVLCAGWVIGAG
jgi:hypothetical protein